MIFNFAAPSKKANRFPYYAETNKRGPNQLWSTSDIKLAFLVKIIYNYQEHFRNQVFDTVDYYNRE